MKKLVLLAIATMLFVNFSFASDNPGKTNTEKVISVIKREMQYPSFAKDIQIEDYVLVNLSVGENGKVKVNQIYSQNDRLAAYVLQELGKIVIKDIKSLESYDMKFVFKLEKV